MNKIKSRRGRKRKHPAITDKVVMVTGGVGYIGSHLVDYILENYNPKIVRLFDKNESGLFFASRKYSNFPNIRYFQGDVRDSDRVMWAMDGVDTVFHTAALKHVGLSEYSPMEPIKTNVYGTENVLRASLTCGVETHVTISTDKAVFPNSVMGATKLLAERLTCSYKSLRRTAKTKFLCVRFGNVFNSTGSVAQVFAEQLKKGEKITVTDKKMVRFFMMIEDAVGLILKSARVALGGEVFILKMPVLKITDLAEVIIDRYCELNGKSPKNIQIEITGKKHGEKIEEILLNENEIAQALDMKDMFVIPNTELGDYDDKYQKEEAERIQKYYGYKYGAKSLSGEIQPKMLSKYDISKLISRSNIFNN